MTRKKGRQSIRLPGYDYSKAGPYFVTMCTHNRRHLFGKVVCGKMILSDAGQMVNRLWLEQSVRFPGLQLDEFVVMPDHMHCLFRLPPASPDTPSPRSSTLNRFSRVQPPLGQVVGAFKAATTAAYAEGVRTHDWPRFDTRLWQRNYHEWSVRHDSSIPRIQTYIRNNPKNWGRLKAQWRTS